MARMACGKKNRRFYSKDVQICSFFQSNLKIFFRSSVTERVTLSRKMVPNGRGKLKSGALNSYDRTDARNK